MTSLFGLAKELQCFLEREGWRFCFIGGLAVQRWGEPRVTQDVDLTLLTGSGSEDAYIDALLSQYAPRVDDAKQFALRSRVLLLRSSSGIGIDVALGGLPFEEHMVERSSMFEFLPEVSLRTCSAEDLVVLKTFAGRQRDWLDVETILVRQRDNLDWGYVLDQLRPLAELKDAPDIVERLQTLRRQLW